MATETPFFDKQIDRTPYAACWWVGILVIAVILTLGYALWQLGSLAQRAYVHFKAPKVVIPAVHTPTPPNTQQLLDQARDQAGQAVQNAAQSAVDSAKASAQTQAQQQLNQFLNK